MAPSNTVIVTELALFAIAAVAFLAFQTRRANAEKTTCDAKKGETKLLNSAFVFVKPHANTAATQQLVKTKLTDAGITILSEADINGKEIDEKKLIDQHYYAIASKATILPAKEIPVPKPLFQETFGESWDTVVAEDRTCNALEACKRFNCNADELDAAWGKAKVVKFGGGFYCGLVSVKDQPALYVFNAFFMTMRSKFVGEANSIHCYVVEWDPAKLSWSDFRNKLLGPTDPADGPAGSIRRTILETYTELGLTEKPNKGDNGVHASASPFEGLAERMNWLGSKLEDDAFGKALLEAGVPKEIIQEWSVDPRVEQPEGGKGSVFDSLEDMDASECLQKIVELYNLNANLI